MIKFWKEHTTLRVVLIAVAFFVGLFLVFFGWKNMPGTIPGLAVMFVGLAFLLFALWLYNKPFQDPKPPPAKKKK